MNARDLPDGLPDCASGNLVGYQTLDRDSDGAYSKLDAWLAEHCDAAVAALPPAQQAAIYTRYGLASSFRFPRGNYEGLLEVARQRILSTLKSRGVWVTA